MKKFNKAFTVAEMLLVIGVIGLVAALTVPILASKRPSKNKAILRKNYYIMERVVGEMKSDDETFPQDTSDRTYFAYYDAVNGVANTYTATKFCEEFAAHVNTISSIGCSTEAMATSTVDSSIVSLGTIERSGVPTFALGDGSQWFFYPNPFCDPAKDEDCILVDSFVNFECPETDTPSPYKCIVIDVDGVKNGPQTFAQAKDTDLYYFVVTYDGKIIIPNKNSEVSKLLKSKSIF